MARGIRVGIGVDVHPLEAGRRLVLGGVEIPYERGLKGWSDGDVLVHAIMDAALGASGLPDIGTHFPPGDERYRDARSLDLLREVRGWVEARGYRVAQICAVIVAEAPRLQPYVARMRAQLAEMLGLNVEDVGIQVTTAEGLGAVGRGEGIQAFAVALLEPL
ncbi:MAG: 2-C-methyl-D-erythritol 2,4-cyclodiphosphate synthase [Armatimonadota bacterium]|nr:2-C-methyl-D-erythritol 2,4-cyclodiphosphate synthase [Armatimonadota bacterium]MDR7570387.1 2-C-methyl-D-erythritol 2,4-cyclodiphosphate synthase [Armatimonadota bacterium]MDR7613796.1 2-C-methyl-D-erythritol 2,4-cyclodiphosphate synthase [Armatimonadota bacterium]